MDDRLLELSVGYHGQPILKHMRNERPDFRIPYFISPPEEGSVTDLPKNNDFDNMVKRFIAKKSDILFRSLEQPPEFPCNKRDDDFAYTPPIESFMEPPSQMMHQHFVKSLKPGDVVSGMVTAIEISGLIITLLCVDVGQLRYIHHLDIKVFCPTREIPRYVSNETHSETFAVNDKVRGVVLNVSRETDRIIVSLLQVALPQDADYIKVGLISDEDFPVHYRKLLEALEDDSSYSDMLHMMDGFRNSSNVATLSNFMATDMAKPPSFMRNLDFSRVPSIEYAGHLRKTQSYRWAISSVAKGVELFKQGQHVEAMQYLNKALQIDETNVEAMVARGALYANNESYERAIEDFDKALSLNPNHSNAQKYYGETLLAHARSLMDGDKLDEAESYIFKAQACNANEELIQEWLEEIKDERKQKELQMKRTEEIKQHTIDDVTQSAMQTTAEKLRKIMEEDKKRQHEKQKKKRSNSEKSTEGFANKGVEKLDDVKKTVADKKPLPVQNEAVEPVKLPAKQPIRPPVKQPSNALDNQIEPENSSNLSPRQLKRSHSPQKDDDRPSHDRWLQESKDFLEKLAKGSSSKKKKKKHDHKKDSRSRSPSRDSRSHHRARRHSPEARSSRGYSPRSHRHRSPREGRHKRRSLEYSPGRDYHHNGKHSTQGPPKSNQQKSPENRGSKVNYPDVNTSDEDEWLYGGGGANKTIDTKEPPIASDAVMQQTEKVAYVQSNGSHQIHQSEQWEDRTGHNPDDIATRPPDVSLGLEKLQMMSPGQIRSLTDILAGIQSNATQMDIPSAHPESGVPLKREVSPRAPFVSVPQVSHMAEVPVRHEPEPIKLQDTDIREPPMVAPPMVVPPVAEPLIVAPLSSVSDISNDLLRDAIKAVMKKNNLSEQELIAAFKSQSQLPMSDDEVKPSAEPVDVDLRKVRQRAGEQSRFEHRKPDYQQERGVDVDYRMRASHAHHPDDVDRRQQPRVSMSTDVDHRSHAGGKLHRRFQENPTDVDHRKREYSPVKPVDVDHRKQEQKSDKPIDVDHRKHKKYSEDIFMDDSQPVKSQTSTMPFSHGNSLLPRQIAVKSDVAKPVGSAEASKGDVDYRQLFASSNTPHGGEMGDRDDRPHEMKRYPPNVGDVTTTTISHITAVKVTAPSGSKDDKVAPLVTYDSSPNSNRSYLYSNAKQLQLKCRRSRSVSPRRSSRRSRSQGGSRSSSADSRGIDSKSIRQGRNNFSNDNYRSSQSQDMVHNYNRYRGRERGRSTHNRHYPSRGSRYSDSSSSPIRIDLTKGRDRRKPSYNRHYPSRRNRYSDSSSSPDDRSRPRSSGRQTSEHKRKRYSSNSSSYSSTSTEKPMEKKAKHSKKKKKKDKKKKKSGDKKDKAKNKEKKPGIDKQQKIKQLEEMEQFLMDLKEKKKTELK